MRKKRLQLFKLTLSELFKKLAGLRWPGHAGKYPNRSLPTGKQKLKDRFKISAQKNRALSAVF